jgi:hypothetical protein
VLQRAQQVPVRVGPLQRPGPGERDDHAHQAGRLGDRLGRDIADMAGRRRARPVGEAVHRHHDVRLGSVALKKEQPQRAAMPSFLVDDGGDPVEHVAVAEDGDGQQLGGLSGRAVGHAASLTGDLTGCIYKTTISH